jgi:YD repeat-containing protein
MQALTEAGARVYALSYDEADALKEFRDAHGITYSLLPDPDSQVIRQFGILNTLIAEHDIPWFGIPFPGTYVIDRDGRITHKFFDSNLAVRAGPEQFLRALRGDSLSPTTAPSRLATATAQVSLDGETLAVGVQRELVARIVVPAGRHIYASPAPPGSVGVDLQLDPNPGLVVRDLIRPASEPHCLAGTNGTFAVHHDTVELRLPITINGSLTDGSARREITVSGTVRWQTCDDEVCDIPQNQGFQLRIPTTGAVANQIRARTGTATREPNAARHFQRLIDRRRR